MSLVRIVRMTIAPNQMDEFLDTFDETVGRVRAQPGCEHLELWKNLSYSNLLSTYSIWRSEEDLERYRQTPLFENTWTTLRGYFAGPPAAESYEVIRQNV